MALNRRRFLRIAGSSAVIAAAGSATWFAASREPRAALRPWEEAGAGYSDPRHWALSWAVLAPNAHNLQSWLVDLDTPGEIVLYVEPDRLLPETDPFSRQIMISLGCFLEILRMAAAERGYEAAIDRFPLGRPGARVDRRPVARVRLVESASIARDPLFAQVRARRSCKEAYDINRGVDAALAARLSAASLGTPVHTATDPATVATLRDLTQRAFDVEYTTASKHRESVDLMRIGRAEIERRPDGIALRGAVLETLHLVGQLTRENLATPGTTAYEQGRDLYHDMLQATPAYVWLATPGNDRPQQLEAGRDYVRLNLMATALGLSMHPVSQALQEYDEMTALYAELHERLGIAAPARVQMLARLGYGPEVPPAPRWSWQQRLV